MSICNEFSAYEIVEKIKNGQLKAVDVVRDAFRLIEEKDSKIGAFLRTDFDSAIKDAEVIDKKSPKNGLLAGVPIANKDNILIKGRVSSCASKILENFTSIYNASAVDNVFNENGIIVGNANMDEFAMGSSTETSYYKKTLNPWDFERVPGGSSGGPAAAVGAGMVPLALGSDTGGSIRQPAAFCGVVGMKPTYGLVSRYGLVAFASSLDQIGPIARNVKDAALLLSAIAGYDEKDSTSYKTEKINYFEDLEMDVKGLKIGVPKEYFIEGLQSDIKNNINGIVSKLSDYGANIEEISLPMTEYAVAVYYIIATAEASSNLARYDGVKYGYRYKEAESLMDMYVETRTRGFGDEVKRRILLGTFVLSSGYYDAYYKRAQKVRTLISQDFKNAFEKVDLIIAPTTPTTAFKFGEKKSPLEMYLSDVFTIPVNLAGLPAMSIPTGFDSSGLPIGMQIIGPFLSEKLILKLGYYIENNIFRIEDKERNERLQNNNRA